VLIAVFDFEYKIGNRHCSTKLEAGYFQDDEVTFWFLLYIPACMEVQIREHWRPVGVWFRRIMLLQGIILYDAVHKS
jgi:hypothetical protein